MYLGHKRIGFPANELVSLRLRMTESIVYSHSATGKPTRLQENQLVCRKTTFIRGCPPWPPYDLRGILTYMQA